MSRWCRLPCGMGRGKDTLTTVSWGMQTRQLSEVGAGLGLQQNAQRVLVLLDLGPEMIRIGSQLKGFRGARAEARRNLRLVRPQCRGVVSVRALPGAHA